MILKLLLLFIATVTPLLAASATNCGCDCCKGKEVCCCSTELAATPSAGPVRRHPLRGVVTTVHPERSSLMVKHEAIPGVMRAMTMLFKVHEATLKAVQKGDRITAMMSRQGGDWWLHEVKTVADRAP